MVSDECVGLMSVLCDAEFLTGWVTVPIDLLRGPRQAAAGLCVVV